MKTPWNWLILPAIALLWMGAILLWFIIPDPFKWKALDGLGIYLLVAAVVQLVQPIIQEYKAYKEHRNTSVKRLERLR